MIKTILAFGALTLAVAAPAAAQMAAGSLPKCSATVRDSCDQGANDPRAMTAAQAEASGGVGDRADDGSAKSMKMAGKPMMHHKKHHMMKTKTTMSSSTSTTGDASASDATPK